MKSILIALFIFSTLQFSTAQEPLNYLAGCTLSDKNDQQRFKISSFSLVQDNKTYLVLNSTGQLLSSLNRIFSDVHIIRNDEVFEFYAEFLLMNDKKVKLRLELPRNEERFKIVQFADYSVALKCFAAPL